MGICVPAELLGTSGHLSMKQSQLKSLSLITDSECRLNLRNQFALSLAKFTALRSLSWRGIQSENDFLSLQGALMLNSQHLQSLELDLGDWALVEGCFRRSSGLDRDEPRNFLAWDVLKLASGDARMSFPSLQELSLSEVSFHLAASEMALAFNFSGLRSLKLNRCLRVRALIEAVLQSGQPTQLTTLELVVESNYLGASDPLIPFLVSFRGLQDLHLLTNDCKVNRELWESILHHRATLKQLVYHERPLEDGGVHDKLILPWEKALSSRGDNLGFQLGYVGLCCSLSDLVGIQSHPVRNCR